MTTDLPRPLTREHEYLVAVCSRLDQQNALLAGIRDRLPAPAAAEQPDPDQASPQAVELREPATPQPPSSSDDGHDAEAGSGGDAVRLTEPASAPSRRPPKKAVAKKTTPGRKAAGGTKET